MYKFYACARYKFFYSSFYVGIFIVFEIWTIYSFFLNTLRIFCPFYFVFSLVNMCFFSIEFNFILLYRI